MARQYRDIVNRPPRRYHHFGDKDGLLDAVVTYGFESSLQGKRSAAPTADPVADLERDWDAQVEFGLTHPALDVLTQGPPQSARLHRAARCPAWRRAPPAGSRARCARARVRVAESLA